MRTIFLFVSLAIAFTSNAMAQQGSDPAMEELDAYANDLTVEVAPVNVDVVPNKVAQPTNINSPRRAHYYVDACGVQVLNQPMNGRHTERMMAQSNDCARTQVAQSDAETRRAQIDNEGVQGHALANALSTAIVSSNGASNTYANTKNGEFATGVAAVKAAEGFSAFDPNDYNSWVEAQAWADQLLNPQPQVVVAPATSSSRPPKIAPTQAPNPTERGQAILDAALE